MEYSASYFDAYAHLKFMFSKKATKIDEIFTVDLTLCTKRQINGEDFVKFRCLLRKYELYIKKFLSYRYEICRWKASADYIFSLFFCRENGFPEKTLTILAHYME